MMADKFANKDLVKRLLLIVHTREDSKTVLSRFPLAGEQPSEDECQPEF